VEPVSKKKLGMLDSVIVLAHTYTWLQAKRGEARQSTAGDKGAEGSPLQVKQPQ
jgi:hypothetical protein